MILQPHLSVFIAMKKATLLLSAQLSSRKRRTRVPSSQKVLVSSSLLFPRSAQMILWMILINRSFQKVSFSDWETSPITILHNKGATKSLLLQSVLPFPPKSFCGFDALVRGVRMCTLRAPIHIVILRSSLVLDPVKIGIRSCLPVSDVALILGNDLAGRRFFHLLK